MGPLHRTDRGQRAALLIRLPQPCGAESQNVGSRSKAVPLPPSWQIVDAAFVAAAREADSLPGPVGVEVAFAGRSNVGKSSLMNALLGRRRLVRTSSAPGCTRQLGFFRAQARDGAVFHLVDLPGYGYAQRSKAERATWAQLVERYLGARDCLRAVVLLVDPRRGLLPEDQQLIAFVRAREADPPEVIGVATKIDKVPRSRRRSLLAKLDAEAATPLIATSAQSGEGTVELWRAIRRATLAT